MKLSQKLQGKTTEEKLRFLYRAIELLRLEHNEQGARFRAKTISRAQWEAYLVTFKTRFKRLMHAANLIKSAEGYFTPAKQDEMVAIKNAARPSTEYDPDIDIGEIRE